MKKLNVLYPKYPLYKQKLLKESAQPFSGVDISFKKYLMFQNNIEAKIEQLKNGLDENSKKYIDYCIDCMLSFPSHTSDIEKIEIFRQSNYEPLAKWWYPKWLMELFKSYEAKSNLYYFGHGLDLLPQKAIKYIENKIAFDLGAFDGESAIVLSNYNFCDIFSFDISLINLQRIKDNLTLFPHINNVSSFHMALSNKKSSIVIADSARVDTNINNLNTWQNNHSNNIEVKVDTLDNFMVNYKNKQIGFIKMDIEGDEINCLAGAKQSIAKDRPILAISIYHHPEQFFETKALIESWNLNYKFIITPLDFGQWSPFVECTLLAYPSELQD